ncbi:MAG: urate hydroxylase PuuD [Steroidobacteraceae bacterium]
MTSYLLDWLNLLGRWVHLITGIAWIGSSFYFVWLDNHLHKPTDPVLTGKGVGGELWSVHGGGFYNAQKYLVAPATLPTTLHWFYWEAYSTFLSGMFLMCLLYYGQAEIYLVDPAVMALSKPVAILIAVGFLAGGWLVYDLLCRSALAKRPARLAMTIFALLAVAAWGLCQLFSGRGAFIQFGAMIGTIMVANVFFVIIPGQREMVRAKQQGREADPEPGRRGKLRSVHNTYFTLPVLFTMLSNHYAITFGSRWNWLVLIAMCTAGALIRAWFVARHHTATHGGRTPAWTVVTGLLLLLGVMVALMPMPAEPRTAAAPAPVAGSADPVQQRFARIEQIVHQRCAGCHAATPTQPGFAVAPKGLMLETPEQLLTHLAPVQLQVASRAMPIGNLSGMTDDERSELLDWIRDGAAR